MTHKVTKETREKVKALAFAGVKNERIADMLGISKRTLQRRYRADLDNAIAEAIGQVGQSLLSQAITGNTAAGIFIMKARAGWRDNGHIDSDGSATPVQIVINPPNYPRGEYDHTDP